MGLSHKQRGVDQTWANQPMQRRLGFLQGPGDDPGCCVPALLSLAPFYPLPGSQPGLCAEEWLRVRVTLPEFVPALEALYALCDLGQISEGRKLSSIIRRMGIEAVIHS